MNRFISKRRRLALAMLLAIALLAIYFMSQPRLAPGEKPLADIRTIETLRAQFNQDAGQIRLIILISPT
jgi:hypothetical protein